MNIRNYAPSDQSAIEHLFEMRGLPFDGRLFEWKKQAPSCYSWVGEVDGNVVAHYSVMELPILSEVRVGFAVDAILSPEHGRLEEVAQLLKHALDEVKSEGLDVVVGLPNDRMAKIKTFLGWKPIGNYHWEKSDGNVTPVQTSVSASRQQSSNYQQWRWQSSPRSYCQIDDHQGEGDPIALFGQLHNGMTSILWHEGHYWETLNATYDFVYLKQGEQSSLLEVEAVVPLFYSLRDDISDWNWPEKWPLETVEGVTLGW